MCRLTFQTVLDSMEVVLSFLHMGLEWTSCDWFPTARLAAEADAKAEFGRARLWWMWQAQNSYSAVRRALLAGGEGDDFPNQDVKV